MQCPRKKLSLKPLYPKMGFIQNNNSFSLKKKKKDFTFKLSESFSRPGLLRKSHILQKEIYVCLVSPADCTLGPFFSFFSFPVLVGHQVELLKSSVSCSNECIGGKRAFRKCGIRGLQSGAHKAQMNNRTGLKGQSEGWGPPGNRRTSPTQRSAAAHSGGAWLCGWGFGCQEVLKIRKSGFLCKISCLITMVNYLTYFCPIYNLRFTLCPCVTRRGDGDPEWGGTSLEVASFTCSSGLGAQDSRSPG